jgi:DNA-binding transcriptional MocR family regulator
LRRIRRVFEDNIDHLIRTIERTFPEGTRVTRPAGGFVLWLELPRPLVTGALFARAIEKGICFVPGHVFSASDRFANCLRLSCGHGWDARIAEGVTALGEMARAARAP